MAGPINSLHKLAAVLSIVFLEIGLASPPLVRAELQPSSHGVNRTPADALAQAFQPPDRGSPPRTADGGTRGCSSFKPGEKALTPLTPPKHLALTTGEHPTFYWYIPQSPGKTLEFSLLDSQDEQVLYKTTVSAPSQSGIVSLSLPSNLPPLQVGKQYHWYLVMACDTRDRTGDVAVDGWLERTALTPDLEAKLQTASPREQVAIYAKAGIWYESLEALIQLRRNYPNDKEVATGWKALLNSVELGQFVEEPLVVHTQTSQK